MPPKCGDCKWKQDRKCAAPENLKPDLVGDGVVRRMRWLFCETMRDEGWVWARILRMCGREGRWFIPR